MVTTRKTLVLKTATVNSVKLSTPADRIGLGLVAVATYPAEVLSPGQFPLPQCPGSEANPGGPWQELSAMGMQDPRAMATAEPPAGPAGHRVPGTSAHRRPSFTRRHLARWQRATKRPAAAGRVASAGLSPAFAAMPAAVASQARFPAARVVRKRIGDCQSPDRRDDRRAASTGEATPTTAAGM